MTFPKLILYLNDYLNNLYDYNKMEDKIKEYIIYYNENLAKPFIWNYTGKILKA